MILEPQHILSFLPLLALCLNTSYNKMLPSRFFSFRPFLLPFAIRGTQAPSVTHIPCRRASRSMHLTHWRSNLNLTLRAEEAFRDWTWACLAWPGLAIPLYTVVYHCLAVSISLGRGVSMFFQIDTVFGRGLMIFCRKLSSHSPQPYTSRLRAPAHLTFVWRTNYTKVLTRRTALRYAIRYKY